MSSTKNKVSQQDGKYWIKPGVFVAHREIPGRKMIVDDILKRTEVIKEGDQQIPKTFVVGIECHWFNEDQSYGRGRFLTMELVPWGEDPSEPKEIEGSFLQKDSPTEVS